GGDRGGRDERRDRRRLGDRQGDPRPLHADGRGQASWLGLRGARRLLDPRAPRGDRAPRHLAIASAIVPVRWIRATRACRLEGPLDVLVVDDATYVVEGHADGIETNRAVARGVTAFAHPGGSEAADAELLAPVNGEDRALGAVGGVSAPRLNLDEDEGVAIE